MCNQIVPPRVIIAAKSNGLNKKSYAIMKTLSLIKKGEL